MANIPLGGATDSVTAGVLRVLTNLILPTGAQLASRNLTHQHSRTHGQPNTTATTETRVVHRVVGAGGTIKSFSAGSIGVCAGAATVTVDLHKNGVSVLSAPVTLNSSSVANVAQDGTVSSASVAAGDALAVVITATAGGGTLGTGAWGTVVLDEDPVT